MWRRAPPTPPVAPPEPGFSGTLETKLIIAATIFTILISGRSIRLRDAPLTYGVVTLLLLVYGYMGSTETLRTLLWSPAHALVLPPGAVLVILGSALVLAVSFTSTITQGTPRSVAAAAEAAAAAAAADATGESAVPQVPPTAATPPLLPLPSAESVAELVRRRRSIFPKDYRAGAEVPRAVIERAIEAANWAPTHGKTEPWRFAVFYGAAGVARVEALKVAATRRALAATPDKLEATLEKMARKTKDVAKCGAILAIVRKRVKGVKGNLMPEWEETCAVACAMQNLHLQLTADGYCGYWSSGGVDGWADDPEVRSLVGADGEVEGERDKVLGWFHIGSSDKMSGYKGRRDPSAQKFKWIDG